MYVIGQKLKLLDRSLTLLFPELRNLPVPCITTVYIQDVLPNDQYVVGIIDIVPTDRATVLLPGVAVTVSGALIGLAIQASDRIRNEADSLQPPTAEELELQLKHQADYQKKRKKKRRKYQHQKLDYDQIAAELQKTGTYRLAIPKDLPTNHFGTLLRSAIVLTRKVPFSWKQEGNELVLNATK